MKTATVIEVLDILYEDYTIENIKNMERSELIDLISEIEEDINTDRMNDEIDIEMYGDPDDDEYNMSDSHRADVQQEQFDWVKNA